MPQGLHLTAVSHRFDDVHVLDDISLDVDDNECVAVLGPTGCGKSTLVRIIAGLISPHQGSVSIGDAPVTGEPGHVAYMPQGDSLLPWRRALDNALLGSHFRGGDTTVRDDAARMFERFGLAGFEQSWPREMSGGMRQRVALLRTVLAKRPVLALDEPFASLDALTRIELHTWLGRLLDEQPRTTVVVTHDIDEALRLADRVVVLSRRPARIVDIVTPPGRRPRTASDVTGSDFGELKRHILSVLESALG